jgi:hypothetical protein
MAARRISRSIDENLKPTAEDAAPTAFGFLELRERKSAHLIVLINTILPFLGTSRIRQRVHALSEVLPPWVTPILTSAKMSVKSIFPGNPLAVKA